MKILLRNLICENILTKRIERKKILKEIGKDNKSNPTNPLLSRGFNETGSMKLSKDSRDSVDRAKEKNGVNNINRGITDSISFNKNKMQNDSKESLKY